MTGFSAPSNRWLKTGLLLPIVALNGWVLLQLFHYFEPLITIFILAAVLAFILNYPVEFLRQRQIQRNYAVLIVLLTAIAALVTAGITIVPTLLEQLSSIVTQLPDWLGSATDRLQAVQGWAIQHRLPINLNRVIQQLTDQLPSQLEQFGDETVALTLNAVGGISYLLLTIVLTLYLLLDGKRIWDAVFHLLPLENRVQMRQSLQNDFHSYFIGQAMLGLVMGVLLSLTFVVLHVPYSLLLGSTIGIMTLIPFGDILGYILISLLLGTQDPTWAVKTLGAALVVDQIVDQAIAPRILGSFTGLKPIWVIISLLLGTKLFGFPGLLTAVPIASFLGSLLEDSPLLPPEPDSIEPDSIKPDSIKPDSIKPDSIELEGAADSPMSATITAIERSNAWLH